MSEESEIIEEEVEGVEEELSIEDEIKSALGESEPEEILEAEVKEEVVEPIVEEVEEKETIPAPQALSGAIKDKWSELPEDVRAEWSKRENDFHQAMTRHDGDLNMGREMKEVIAPYMATIQAEGGTPAAAVKDLLNTAYVLRTGSPHQKAEILRTVAQQYNIDMGQASQPQQQQNPELLHLQNEIAQLRQSANPEYIKSQLQEEMESANMKAEVDTFAAKSENVYLEQVKPLMASLLNSGQAKDLQEAYDKACWSDPVIRASLLSAQKEEQEAKRKAEVKAKKHAAVSINGSPDLASPSARTNNLSLEDEIKQSMLEARGSI